MAILTRLTEGMACSIHRCMCMTGEGRAKFSLSNYLEQDHIVIMLVRCSIGVVFARFYRCGYVYIYFKFQNQLQNTGFCKKKVSVVLVYYYKFLLH
jgi:hypothetical protein